MKGFRDIGRGPIVKALLKGFDVSSQLCAARNREGLEPFAEGQDLSPEGFA